MAAPGLYRYPLNLPWSASGLPVPREDCCPWLPDRPNSLIQPAAFVTCNGEFGVNFLHAGERQTFARPLTTIGLGIKSP